MKRPEYIKKVADAMGTSVAKAKDAVKAIEAVIFSAVKAEDEVPMGKIGKIGGKSKPARMAKNPQTGADIKVPAKTGQPYAKFSKTIKE